MGWGTLLQNCCNLKLKLCIVQTEDSPFNYLRSTIQASLSCKTSTFKDFSRTFKYTFMIFFKHLSAWYGMISM